MRSGSRRSGGLTRGPNCQAGPWAFRTAQSSSVRAEPSDDPVQAGGPGGWIALAHSNPSMYRLPPGTAGQPLQQQPNHHVSAPTKSSRLGTYPRCQTVIPAMIPTPTLRLTTQAHSQPQELSAPPSLPQSTGFLGNLDPLLFPVLSSLYGFLSVVVAESPWNSVVVQTPKTTYTIRNAHMTALTAPPYLLQSADNVVALPFRSSPQCSRTGHE